MRTIHLSEGSAETDTDRVAFALSEGEFSEQDVAVIQARMSTGRQWSTSRRHERGQSVISITYDNARGMVSLVTAFEILKQRYPNVRFTTYSNRTKQALGERIDQIKIRYAG
jgi:hypothetical protein